MADEVKIPINLEVTDLDISKVNTKDLESGMKAKLVGVRKAFDDIMNTINTTHVSKEFNKAATNINNSFRNAESAVKGLSKSISDLDKGTGSMKGVEKSAEDVVTAFKRISEEYGSFSSSANAEMTLTPQFRNTLSVVQDMMREMKAYTAWTEKASEDSNTTSEYWEKLEIYTKSAKANIQSMLADLREMVRSGEAFKLGKDEASSSDYMHMLKSLQGTAQANFNRANFLFGGSGNSASSDLIAARTEVDRLSHSLELAKMNLETMMRGEKTTNPQIEAMQAEVHQIVAQLAEAEARYQELYDAAYGVAEETQQAAAATVELEAASSGASNGLQISDAVAVSLSESLNTIIELLGEMAAKGEETGDAVGEGFEQGSEHINKAKNHTKELQQAFSAARNVMTATIMTLNQLGSVGTIIAQIIGIVQLLTEAFRDAATAAHSIIPIVGLFVGLAINIFGRLISIVKKLIALLKQVGLAILSVAKKVGGVLSGAVKKLAGLFKSLMPSMSTLNKIKGFLTRYLLGFRSSYFLIRKIRQAVIDGMKDIAAAAPEVNEYMSNFSTALNQIKGSLTAAFEPILSFVIPVLTRLLYVLAQVLTYVAKFNAVLVGRDYYYDYAAAMQDYADGIGGVGKAAKKAQKDLMGFDEINRLSAPNQPSGSGGGLGGDFAKTAIDTADAVSKFAEMIKEAWAKSDFTEVGQTLGTKFNDILKAWNSSTVQNNVRRVAKNIATDFATLINGFVETEDLGTNLGKSIANLFNTAFTFLYKFATTVHWDSVGKFVGDGIASALANFDWKLFFNTIVEFVNGLADMISNAVNDHEWFNIGYSIADGLIDAVMKFDAAKAGKAVSDFFAALLKLINGFISKMNEESWVLDSVIGYGPNGRQEKWVKKNKWSVLGDKVKEFFTYIDVNDVSTTAGTTMGNIINGIVDFLTAADFHETATTFFDKFLNSLDATQWKTKLYEYWETTLFPAIKDLIQKMGPHVKQLLEDLWAIIKGPVTEFGKWIGGAIMDGIKDNMPSLGDIVFGPIKGLWNFGEDLVNGAWDLGQVIGEKIVSDDSLNPLQKQIQDMQTEDYIKKLSDKDIADLRESWNEISKGTQEALQKYSDDFDDLTVKTASATTKMSSDVKTSSDKIQTSTDKIGQSTSAAAEAAGSAYGSIGASAVSMGDVVASGFDTATQAMENSMGAVAPAAQGAYASVVQAFDQLTPYMEETTGAAVNAFFATLRPSGDLAQGLALATNSVVKSSVNTMVDAINNVAIAPLQNLASLLDRLRTLNVGGLTPFSALPKLSFYKIPKLAQGAVLPPNQPFLSVVGDQKSGTNIEAPLDTIRQAVAEVMNENLEGMMAGFEAVVQAIQNKDMSVRIGDRDIAQANDRYQQRLNTMRGV